MNYTTDYARALKAYTDAQTQVLIRHAKAKGDVWFATHAQIAAYVKGEAGL